MLFETTLHSSFCISFNHIVLAHLQFSFAVTQMHSIALAIAPHLAFRALVGLHPFSVAVNLELVLPHVPETVLVDIALMVVAANAETARDGAVGQYRGHIDAGTARIIVVAHLALILAEEAVAAVVGTNLALQAGLFDELHHLHKLLVAELEVGLVGGATERKHRKQSPTTDTQGNQEIAELRQVFDGALVDASNDIPS